METGSRRQRDAERTREALLRAARRRFAREGYAATTVRDIAEDAGANMALINRYFGSKEGLFEACLTSAREELSRADAKALDVSQLVDSMMQGMADVSPDSGLPEAMLLFVRSSGDARAERIRVSTLQGFGERIAALATTGGATTTPDDVELRGQLVLALALGIAALRVTPELEPIAHATTDELHGPLNDAVTALLQPPERRRSTGR